MGADVIVSDSDDSDSGMLDFMPEELLTSQYATLELPEDGPEDGFLVLDTTDDPGPEHSSRRVADLLAAAAARP